MLSVMIVEDDIIARNRICSMIDWEALGFFIVAQASNGSEAIKLAKSLKPRLVFADVSMPVMDGIELSQQLVKLDDTIHLVMISSYSDYHYIRETFKNGAHDYLLKDDLTPDILSDTLMDVKQKVSEAPNNKQDISPHQQLSDLLLGVDQTTHTVQLLLDSIGFPKDTERFVLLVFRLYYYDYMTRDMDCRERMMHSRSILAFVDELFTSVPHSCVWMGSGQFALLMTANSASMGRLQSEVEESISRVDKCLLKYLDARAQHGWAEFSKNHLRGAYKVVIDNMDDIPSSASAETLAFPYITRIIDSLEQADAAACEVYIKDFFLELKKDNTSLWAVQPVILYLLSLLDQVIGWRNIPHDKKNFAAENICRCNSLDELQECMQQCFRTTVLALKAARGKRLSSHIETAMMYMRQHYREQITLSKVAAHVGVAPNYLSGQFSSETGMTFVEYLNKVRVEAADRLMQTTTYSIKEIYHQVGYNSYNYFFKVYKDVRGESLAQRNRKI